MWINLVTIFNTIVMSCLILQVSNHIPRIHGQQQYWSFNNNASLSQARFSFAAAGSGHKVLFGGGQYNSIPTYSNVVDIFDANLGSWSTASLSQARVYLAAAGAGTKVLFAGGQPTSTTYSKVVDIYDVNTGNWSTAMLSQARSGLAAAASGSKVLFGGGYYGIGLYSKVVDIYDVNTGIWSTSSLSQARNRLVATGTGNKVLFAGGWNGNNLNVVDIYDINTGNWSTASLSEARYRLSASSAGNKVLFAGGWNGTSPFYSNVVDIYDVDTGNWSVSILSQARFDLASASIGSKVFVGGGFNGNYSNVVDVYDVYTGMWSKDTLSVPCSRLVASSTDTTVLFAGGFNGTNIYSSVVDIFVLSTTSTTSIGSTAPVSSSASPTTVSTTTVPVPPVFSTESVPTSIAPLCMSPAPTIGASCHQGTWIAEGTITLSVPLQVDFSNPLLVQGDLNQSGYDILASISVTLVVPVPPLIVNGTARLNGTLILQLVEEEDLTQNSSWSKLVLILQADTILGTFDSVNITSANSQPHYCTTQKTDGHNLYVLLASPSSSSLCKKEKRFSTVAIVVPFVCIVILVGTSLLVWYLLRVRRVWTGADWLLRSQRHHKEALQQQQEQQHDAEYQQM